MSFCSFLIESSHSFCSSMVAIYLQNRMKLKKDGNCLTSCQSANNLPFKNVVSDLLFNFIVMHILYLVSDALVTYLFETLRA